MVGSELQLPNHLQASSGTVGPHVCRPQTWNERLLFAGPVLATKEDPEWGACISATSFVGRNKAGRGTGT